MEIRQTSKNQAKEAVHGRGASDNPPNRFEELHLDYDKENPSPEDPVPTTQIFKDRSQSLITYNDSPDVGFNASINVYRGCEHGCIYCYARPTHEYLGFSAGLDFETKLMVKENAPELLRKELSSKKYQPQVLAMSGVTDCYQPVERHLKLTRRCLEVLAEFQNPVAIITKNHLVTRDIDLLSELAKYSAVAVFISVTTLDSNLARILEPRASTPLHRLQAIEQLSQAGIPTGVMVAPTIPALNDSEIPAILHSAARAGAQQAGFVMLRLPYGVKNLFQDWLKQHFPDRKEKILHRIESIRGGKLNETSFGKRMRGEGIFAEQIAKLFQISCKKAGIMGKDLKLSIDSFRRPNQQLGLF